MLKIGKNSFKKSSVKFFFEVLKYLVNFYDCDCTNKHAKSFIFGSIRNRMTYDLGRYESELYYEIMKFDGSKIGRAGRFNNKKVKVRHIRKQEREYSKILEFFYGHFRLFF